MSDRGSLIIMMDASRATWMAIAGLSVLLAAASPAHSQAPAAPNSTPQKSAPPAFFTVISPIYGQLVRFSMPSNFVAVFENARNGNYIREAVLQGETVNAWTQMITITGAEGLARYPQAAPENFATSVAAAFKKSCRDTFDAKPIGAIRFGNHDGFAAVGGCGRMQSGANKYGETALIIAVRGSADVYTIQWAERAPGVDKPPVDDAKWQERRNKLKPIVLCPIVPGEAAPYPSCAKK